MKNICGLCGGESHSWRSCPTLKTRKTVPIYILEDALRTLELSEKANESEGVELLDDIDREELSRYVREGYTSGRLDSQADGRESKHISWELKINAWKD